MKSMKKPLPSLNSRLCALEKELSDVRKTQAARTFLYLETLEEVSLIRQAKREHLTVFAAFSCQAFDALNSEILQCALKEGIIDHLC